MIPNPKKIPVTHSAHGKTRVDEYDWMRAANWQEVMANPTALDAEIHEHLEAENAHFRTYMDQHEALTETLFQEMKGRIKERDDSLPTKNKTHVYWRKFEEGQQYSILMRAPADALDAAAVGQVVWDSNLAAAKSTYYALGVAAPDPFDKHMLIGEDCSGAELYDLRVMDMATGSFLADTIAAAGSSGVWDAHAQSFFYCRLDDNHRPYQVCRHVLGQDPAADTVVYEETDPGFFAGVSKSESGEFIMITSGDHITSEIYLLPADRPDAPLELVSARRSGHEYSLTHVGEWLYILTNRGGASVDFEICRAPVSAPGEENWQVFVPHETGCLILSIFAVEGYLIRLERREAKPLLIVQDLAAATQQTVAMDAPAYSLGAGTASNDFADQRLRFTLSSPAQPAETYDLDLKTGARTLRKTQEVPSGHDPEAYVVERHMVTARDGVRVPLTLLRRRDVVRPAPAYLYGYGSYGMAMPSGFSTQILSLVDRGMVYALAHIRGGMEQGYSWYLDGKLANKQNTFNDFEDCARFLIEAGYSTQGKIAIEGGSAGGLLVGAVMNQAPELFGAVAAHVPFVDVINTISDATLPLTPIEWNEWGNPIEDAAAYDTIAAYSPYDQVRAQAYPPLMVTAGLSDPRVTYWEPAKWVARLRDRRTNETLMIFKTNMAAGHGGRSGRFEHLREKAETYAFFLDALGV